MSDTKGAGQSGGINNTGTINIDRGYMAGRDMTVKTTSTTSKTEVALQPIANAVKEASPALRQAAEATLSNLKEEAEKAEKGEKPDDTVISGLLKALVGLVPSAVSTIVSAFGTPILGALAGPATKAVLNSLGDGK